MSSGRLRRTSSWASPAACCFGMDASRSTSAATRAGPVGRRLVHAGACQVQVGSFLSRCGLYAKLEAAEAADELLGLAATCALFIFGGLDDSRKVSPTASAPVMRRQATSTVSDCKVGDSMLATCSACRPSQHCCASIIIGSRRRTPLARDRASIYVPADPETPAFCLRLPLSQR